MTRTQVQLTDEQLAALKARATRENVSLSELVRRAVDAFVANEFSLSAAERRRRAIEAAGRFRSGKHDTSTRHDEALAEAYR